MDKMAANESLAVFLSMGMGKTVITLTVLQYLRRQREAMKILIIAPKKVAESTWDSEAAKWDHTKSLTFSKIIGTKRQREEAVKAPADIYLINRENVPWLVDYFKTCEVPWQYDTVIIDELSSFKSWQAQRVKKLKSVRGQIRRIYGLTGTPASNGYMDLFSQIFLLDKGKRLGKTITEYRRNYFIPSRYVRNIPVDYKLLPGAAEEINKKLADICISMSADDYLELPEKIEIDVPVKLPAAALKNYRTLKRDFLAEIDGEEITAASAAALSGKLLQVAAGGAYDEQGQAVTIHSEKTEAVKEIIEAAGEESVIVYYWFKFEREALLAGLKEFSPRELLTDKDVKEWNAGKIKVLIAHPASAGYGLNLQQGGRIIVWTCPTWNLELYEQANARLYRQGQTKPVLIYKLMADGTIDGKVYSALKQKDVTQRRILEAVKGEIK